jgi:hypothetical protein
MPVTLRSVKGTELTHAELDGNFALFYATSITTVIIVNGVVTVTGAGTYKIDTEGAAATDDVHTINGTVDSQRVRFRVANAARTVRFMHHNSGGNLRMNPPEFTLNSLCDHIEFENVNGTMMAERGRLSVPDT